MRDRAYRRHQREKLLDKWAKIAKLWQIDDEHVRYREGVHGWVVRTAGNMPICSKPWCCGNIRKLGHLTKQEIQAIDSERDQIISYDSSDSLEEDYTWSEELQDYI